MSYIEVVMISFVQMDKVKARVGIRMQLYSRTLVLNSIALRMIWHSLLFTNTAHHYYLVCHNLLQ